eukprot:9716141-Prorocentrum_lima.AAC.1
MADCDTPLLLSLASQEASGAVIWLRDLRSEPQGLNIEIHLQKTGNHLAVRVDGFSETGDRPDNDEEQENKNIKP